LIEFRKIVHTFKLSIPYVCHFAIWQSLIVCRSETKITYIAYQLWIWENEKFFGNFLNKFGKISVTSKLAISYVCRYAHFKEFKCVQVSVENYIYSIHVVDMRKGYIILKLFLIHFEKFRKISLTSKVYIPSM
jgi:hypothetical protein